MKQLIVFIALFFILYQASFSQDYTTSVTFPAGYQIGDYVEFLQVAPQMAGASGYYEISIAYTRGNIAAAATHLASISHSNPALWREVGRINNNVYVHSGGYNFTIDCNTNYGNSRFRIRAVSTLGVTESPLPVIIKVRSINFNSAWTALNNIGNDLSVTKYIPMTNDWSLYVGNPFTSDGANLALRAVENGNVGIGTLNPTEKLSVNGKIRAKEIKVEAAPWPDYVFAPSYKLPALKATEQFIKEHKHLPEIPSAIEVKKDGVNLGEMNAKLLKKIEELTLHLIDQNKRLDEQDKKNAVQQKEIEQLKSKL